MAKIEKMLPYMYGGLACLAVFTGYISYTMSPAIVAGNARIEAQRQVAEAEYERASIVRKEEEKAKDHRARLLRMGFTVEELDRLKRERLAAPQPSAAEQARADNSAKWERFERAYDAANPPVRGVVIITR